MIYAALFFPLAALALPPPPAAVVEVPETVVSLSIFDLIPRAGAKKLPPGYGEKVAQAVLSQRAALSRCLTPGRAWAAKVSASILISREGRGAPSLREKPGALPPEVAHCLEEALGSVAYPKHRLSRGVTVEFPLWLERKIL